VKVKNEVMLLHGGKNGVQLLDIEYTFLRIGCDLLKYDVRPERMILNPDTHTSRVEFDLLSSLA
jgi:hypothetical protein